MISVMQLINFLTLGKSKHSLGPCSLAPVPNTPIIKNEALGCINYK